MILVDANLLLFACHAGAPQHHPGPAPALTRSSLLYKIHLRRQAVTVRLNITLDEDLYLRLKKELPPKGISAFIAAAVRARLLPDSTVLDAAYRAARKEPWRRSLADEWSATETEAWPE